MTFQKSSAKTRFYDLIHSLRSYLFIPAAAMAFLFMLMQNFSSLRNLMSLPEADRWADYRYYFFDFSYEIGIVRVFLFGLGVLVGLFAFGFVNNKKMSSTFFTFNIKRSGLFINRCISSFVHIALVILIPMLFNLIVNNHYFGFDQAVFMAWIYLFLAMLVYAVLGFAFTALAAVSAGSSIEAIIYTVFLYVAPFILMMSTDLMLGKYLKGYPFTVTDSRWSSPTIIGARIGVLNRLRAFNPMTYLNSVSATSQQNYLSTFGHMEKGSKINIGITEYAPVILWAVVSALALVAAFIVLNRRKAENAGGFGKNKAAKNIAVSLFSATAFCLALVYSNVNLIFSIMLGVLAFTLAYFVLELIILRNLREIKEGLLKFPIILVITIMLLVIPLSGGLGYSKRVPKPEDVKEVYTNILSTNNIYFTGNYYTAMGAYTSKNDKENILNLHEILVKEMEKKPITQQSDRNDRVGSYYVQYKLKNGKYINRYFSIDGETLKKAVIDFANSDYSKTTLNELFIPTLTAREIEKLSSDYYNGRSWALRSLEEQNVMEKRMLYANAFGQDGHNEHYLISKDGTVAPEGLTSLLTINELTELKKCIVDDALRLGAEKMLYPKEKVLGGIWFSGYFHDEEMDVEMDVALKNPDGSEYIKRLMLMFDGYTVQVTESMTQTTKYLKDKDLLKYFDSEKKIKAAGFINVSSDKAETVLDLESYYYFSNDNQSFGATYYKMKKDDKLNDDVLEIVSDITKAQKLYDAAKMVYPSLAEGYYVQFMFNDNTTAILFVPSDEF